MTAYVATQREAAHSRGQCEISDSSPYSQPFVLNYRHSRTLAQRGGNKGD
jgi:hypothetical protein